MFVIKSTHLYFTNYLVAYCAEAVFHESFLKCIVCLIITGDFQIYFLKVQSLVVLYNNQCHISNNNLNL